MWPKRNLFKRALKCKIRVGLSPFLPVERRHGTVTFQVSGFGKIQRHFLVDDLLYLEKHPKRLAMAVARQIMLLDPTLPKREDICQPTRIDIVGNDMRRVYDLPTLHLTLAQPT